MNMYYFYKWKSKPMNIINLKYQSGNPELRLGEAGGPKHIICMKIIQSIGASVCLLSENRESTQCCACSQTQNMGLSGPTMEIQTSHCKSWRNGRSHGLW